MKEIVFYRTQSGASPVEDFLNSLSGKQAQKVLWKKLVNTDDIWEVRVQIGNNIFRLLGFFGESDLIILTNGFAKKTQKTPSQEINLAEQRKRDYLNRRFDDE